jgi:hypothetical protein
MADMESKARSWFDTVEARDWDALAAMYTTHAEYIRSDGTARGHKEILDYLKGIVAAFPNHSSDIRAVHVSDQAVTIEWIERATHTQPYTDYARNNMIVAPTGKSFEVKVADVFRFEGDLIAAQHEYYDLLSLLTQVGWM